MSEKFENAPGKVRLEIFDAEKGIVISLYLIQDEYDRAIADMNYAYKLLNEYENCLNQENVFIKQGFNGETDIIPEEDTNDSRAGAVGAQWHSPSLSQSPGQSQNEDGFWSHEETKLLISLYGQHKDDFSHAKKKKHVWDIIAEKMNSYNYNRSAAKIERKWINLLRVYRSIKDNKGPKKTGRGSQNYKFFDDLDDILGDKPSNNNTFCVEVGVNRCIANIENQGSSNCSEDMASTSSPLASGETSDMSSTLTELREIRSHKNKRKINTAQSEHSAQAKLKRHEERMSIENQKLLLEREKIDLLKKILENQETRKGN